MVHEYKYFIYFYCAGARVRKQVHGALIACVDYLKREA